LCIIVVQKDELSEEMMPAEKVAGYFNSPLATKFNLSKMWIQTDVFKISKKLATTQGNNSLLLPIF
jgi:hypothetical protein